MSEISTEEQNNVTKNVEGFHPRINEINQKFINDLLEEKERLGEEFPLCALLIDEGNQMNSRMQENYIILFVRST